MANFRNFLIFFRGNIESKDISDRVARGGVSALGIIAQARGEGGIYTKCPSGNFLYWRYRPGFSSLFSEAGHSAIEALQCFF